MARECEVVKECSTPATHYVMDADPGGWAMWSCQAHVETGCRMFRSSIVYDERQVQE
jgi:hypothetical protein